MSCRFCGSSTTKLIDLGNQPASNDFHSSINEPKRYPLICDICTSCLLVQTRYNISPESMFNNQYPYFSGESPSWVNHCNNFAEKIIKDFGLTRDSYVLEIASNDGTGLQVFKDHGITCVGIDASENVANVANSNGIFTINGFFGSDTVGIFQKADLVIARNVLAHVPDINDFVKSIHDVLGVNGIVVFEFPSVAELIVNGQFDTIYHEHYSYLSFHTVKLILEKHGLEVMSCEVIKTHGGSYRIYAGKKGENFVNQTMIDLLIGYELLIGINDLDFYLTLYHSAKKIKHDFVDFLVRNRHKKLLGYGAPAKANTLLNYCGIKSDLLTSIVDKSPHKTGKLTPGSNINIFDESIIKSIHPEYIIILPWNLKEAIVDRLSYVREFGCKFVTVIPKLEIF